jgi:hypothetical protein
MLYVGGDEKSSPLEDFSSTVEEVRFAVALLGSSGGGVSSSERDRSPSQDAIPVELVLHQAAQS